jgi:hypothetical protein
VQVDVAEWEVVQQYVAVVDSNWCICNDWVAAVEGTCCEESFSPPVRVSA